ncbi:putative DNA-binding domain-containing protein [Novosphingobium aquiterrae]|uniref:DNA-binding domain-containing protein n=1 Tax=Novosphingobium aquiterrae TaxID=624388 RepID=A0ABV6PEL9_9SPHN
MSELAHFQRQFADGLAQPLAPAAPMRIYLNTVMLGAFDALAANFPVTQAILGERAFEALALAYARSHPPEQPILTLYGDRFPDWLAVQPIARELPYLADVARCEQLRGEALHAADAPVLTPVMLESVEPDRLLTLKLRLHPAARFAWLQSPAMAILQAHLDGFEGELAPEWKPGGALFTRPGTTPLGHTLDSPSHRLLGGIRLGERLGGAAQAASLLFPESPIGDCFGHLVRQGAFAAIHC